MISVVFPLLSELFKQINPPAHCDKTGVSSGFPMNAFDALVQIKPETCSPLVRTRLVHVEFDDVIAFLISAGLCVIKRCPANDKIKKVLHGLPGRKRQAPRLTDALVP